MLRWYLIHTKPRGERVARANLERQGYQVYFPELFQPRRQRGQWRGCLVALFPRYLFLHLDEGRQSLSPVRSTLGVANLVRFGSNPAVVPDCVIDGLRARADADSGLHRLHRQLPFVPGSIVKIVMRPFDGLEGIFERDDGTERAVVLLKLLGQDAPVRVPMGCLVPSPA